MKNLGQAMLDALTPSLTLCPSEPHICDYCQRVVPPFILHFVDGKGIPREKQVQPRCKCECEAQEKGLIESVEMHKKREIEQRFSISNLGERFAESTFDKFTPVEGTEKAMEFCQSYANTFPSYGSDALLIWGTYGNGKSHLAAAIAHSIKGRGHTVVFQTMPDLLERIKSTFNGRNKESEHDVMVALQTCELLILDDIGAENINKKDDGTSWVQDVLFRIVDGRYRQKRPILYTTNLKPSELKDRVGPRIYDRIVETSLLVENTGSSFRMKIAEKRFREMKDVIR